MNKLCGICGKEGDILEITQVPDINICKLCLIEIEKIDGRFGDIKYFLSQVLKRLAALEANQIPISKIGGSLGDIPGTDKFYLDPETGRFADEKEIPRHSHE